MFGKNFFKNLWEKIKNSLSKSKSSFENLWRNTQDFFSENEIMFAVILLVVYCLVMLAMFSDLILLGLEKKSPYLMAVGIAGGIFIIWLVFWVSIQGSKEKENRQIPSELKEIQSKLCSNEKNLLIVEGILRKFSFDQQMFRNEIQFLLTEIYQNVKKEEKEDEAGEEEEEV